MILVDPQCKNYVVKQKKNFIPSIFLSVSHSGPFDPDFFQNYIPLGLMGVAKINKRLPIGYKCTLVRPKVMVSVTKMDGITKQAA